MFASLGFNVDTSGLEKFRQGIKLARTDITNMGRDAGTASTKLTGLSKALDGLSNKLDKVSVKKANESIAKSYEEVSKSVGLVEKSLTSIQTNQKGITKALGKIHASVKAGEPIWDKYRASVKSTRDELTSITGKMKDLRANSTVSLKVNQGGTSSTREPRQSNQGFFSSMMGGTVAGGIGGGFFRSMMPAVAIGGGLGSIGYGVKEVVQRGRDQQRMENILMFATKDASEFGDALQYVRKEALRLGLDSAELGRAFAQVSMSASESLSMEDRKKMFTDMSEYIATTGASREDQKLIFKAVNQMFSLGRMQAEEMNQLTERGIPRQMIYDVAKSVLGLKSTEEVIKAQEAGKLDPAKILPQLFEEFSKKARDSGAFDKAMSSSLVAQNRAIEQFNQLSQQIMDSGFDKLLANLFNVLTDLVTVISDITAGMKGAKQAVDELTGGNSLLATVMTIILALFLRNRKAIVSAGNGLSWFGKIAQGFTALLNGRLGQAILNIIKRFGIWGAAITTVLGLFNLIGKAMKRRDSGEWTWIDDLILKFDTLLVKTERAMMELELAWHNMTNGMNFGSWEVSKTFYNSVKSLKPTQIPSANAYSEASKQTSESAKAMQKVRESQQRPIPFASAGNSILNYKVPKITIDQPVNVQVDVHGNAVRDISVYGSVVQ